MLVLAILILTQLQATSYSYKLSIGKTAKTTSSSSTARENRESEAPGEEEGSSWMADGRRNSRL